MGSFWGKQSAGRRNLDDVQPSRIATLTECSRRKQRDDYMHTHLKDSLL